MLITTFSLKLNSNTMFILKSKCW